MRLVVIPHWVAKTLDEEGISHQCLMDYDKLKPYFSQNDLRCYGSIQYAVSDWLRSYFGLDVTCGCLSNENPTSPVYFSSPFASSDEFKNSYQPIIDQIESMDGKDAEEGLFCRLIGRRPNPGEGFTFSVSVIHAEDGIPTVALRPILCDLTSTETIKECACKFLDALCEVLYAHNPSLKDLTAQGFLGAYNQRSV